MMLYNNTKLMIHSLDSDTDFFFFDVVAGVLQRDTIAPSLFIVSRDYIQ